MTEMKEQAIALRAAELAWVQHTTSAAEAARQALHDINEACDQGKLGIWHRELADQVGNIRPQAGD